jgi:dolichol-phosphate mannosyltransferase
MKLLIIIPTYNEIENIEGIINAVFLVIPEYAGILVVDDSSPDGTADTVTKLLISGGGGAPPPPAVGGR